MRNVIRYLGTYVCLSVFLGLVWAILSYPDRPSTVTEWIWVFILALPLQLVGEFLGDVLWKNRVSHFVEQKTAAKSFSVLRILYGFLLVSVTIALLLGAGYGWQALRSCLGLTFP